MRVWHLSHSGDFGGAARAASRLHAALLKAGLDSSFHVARTRSAAPGVVVSEGLLPLAISRSRSFIGRLISDDGDGPVTRSLSILPSRWHVRVNQSDADIVHLHWINAEMLSIEDIGRITKPVVWTLHDMWPFCGAEHYATDERYREGYHRANRPALEDGPDLNRWVWARKRRSWCRPMTLVAPSRWLARCARQSALMGDWPLSVVPYPLDDAAWAPVDRDEARRAIGVPADCRLVAFGAMGGGADPRKGLDLLMPALRRLHERVAGIALITFGGAQRSSLPESPFPTYSAGYLDDEGLRNVYSAADVLAIPSRQDNLPLVALEAMACGTPIAGFDRNGLPDVVEHRKTGWLSPCFDSEDLADGIRWMLEDPSRLAAMRTAARRTIQSKCGEATIARSYMNVYEDVLAARETPARMR